MELILWRHAEAEDGDPDLGRILTAKGRRQAKIIARWLASRIKGDCRILASPAERTIGTAGYLSKEFEIVDGLAPGASAQTVLRVAGWPTSEGTVIVVGHQPTLGAAAALAMTRKRLPWSLKKGAVVWLHRRQRADSEEVVLRAAIDPSLVHGRD